MKKTILTIMVAAMMLVAFTACEQQPLFPAEKKVLAITDITGPDYLVGQEFNAADFTVTVKYTDNTEDTLNGAGLLTVTGFDATATAAGTYTVTAQVGATVNTATAGTSATATATGTFNVYDVDSIAITTQPTVLSFEENTTLDDSDLAGIVVTASYNKGKTMVLDASEITLQQVGDEGLDVPAYDDSEDAENTAEVIVATKLGEDTKKTATYEINVLEAVDDPYEMENDPVEVHVTVLEGAPDAIYYDQNVSVFTDFIEVRVSDQTSLSTWDDTNSVVVTDYDIAWGAGVTNNKFTVAGTDLTTAEEVAYTITYGDEALRTSGTVDVYNYVKSISVGESKIDNAVKGTSTTDSKDDVDVTGTLAYDSNTADEQDATADIDVADWYFNNPYFSGSSTERITYVNALGSKLTTTVPVTYAE